MKKNLGVSMISLVITIIVIIILAAVAFGSSTDTIENANFSNFTNNIAEVQNLLDQQAVTLKGIEGKNGVQRTDAQVYNYIAKGATLVDKDGKNWLTRAYAEKMHCTQLSGDAMPKVIDYELPKIKTSTQKLNSVECSYFVTKTGTVFIWPPYIYNNELYVNGDTKLVDENGNAYTPESGEVYTTYSKPSATFRFDVDGVEILVGALSVAARNSWLNDRFSGVRPIQHHIDFGDDYQDKLNDFSYPVTGSPRGWEYFVLYELASQN